MIKFSKLNMCRHCLIVSYNALLQVFGIPSLTDSVSLTHILDVGMYYNVC